MVMSGDRVDLTWNDPYGCFPKKEKFKISQYLSEQEVFISLTILMDELNSSLGPNLVQCSVI